MNLKRSLARLGKPKFRATTVVMPRPRRILDIGIANDSYQECKAVFVGASYDGLDYQDAGISMQPGDRFVLCNLEQVGALEGLSADYDLIIINHVLEHLRNGQEVYARLCRLLAPGGVLYAEFPSLRTAHRLKSRGSYHFHDDPTHRRFYCLESLANSAMDSNCRVLSCGPISTPLKNLLAVPRALAGWVTGAGYGPFLLHMLGKIDHIMVRREADFSVP